MLHSKIVLRTSNSLFSKSLFSKSVQGFAFGKRKSPTPKDLDKYDVIIIGCNLGAILSRQFEKLTHKHYKVMVVFDRNVNEQLAIRGIYEQGKAAKTDYLLNAKLGLDTNTAHSDGVGCDKILPEENSIVLRNGRKIEYDHLVVAQGFNEDLQAIKGFEDAWADLEHPVFSHREHPSWRTNDSKHQRWIFNRTHGNAYFCIPPLPYKGEVTSFNFFNAAEVWRWYASNAKLSPVSNFTVANANDTFCQYFDQADQFIKENLKKNGVDVELNTKLVEIDKKNFKATFENQSGEKSIRDYSSLYVIPPTKPHQNLVDSGLATKESNYLLDVDRGTLRHRKYKNIFGLGEVNNIPTTKGFWNGMYQVHYVKHNLNRSLHGQSLNAVFDGSTKVPLQLGQKSLTFVVHYYDQKPGTFNLLGKNGGIIAKLRYSRWAKSQKKAFMGIYLGKSYGPPYYRLPVYFRGEASTGPEPTTHQVSGGSAPYVPVTKGKADVTSH